MFENSGSKIKVLAKIMFWVLAVGSVIAALAAFGGFDFEEPLFYALFLGGPLVAYVVNLFLYGFGELVQNVQYMKYVAEKAENKPAEEKK